MSVKTKIDIFLDILSKINYFLFSIFVVVVVSALPFQSPLGLFINVGNFSLR
jgi:hypothetical protein